MQKIKKKLPANCISHTTHIHWMEIHVKGGRKQMFESKYHDVKVKSLKQKWTLVCTFSYVEEEKIFK